MSNRKTLALLGLCGVALNAPGVLASDITVTIENLQGTGGFSFTPFWLGVHDGSFDVFDAGSVASGGIVEIAELGDTSVLSSRFTLEQASGAQATFLEPNGPPVFSPGESASLTFNVGDATVNRYFNYASMVVPTNDLFVGNDNAIELFDAGGNFNGPVVIEIFGSSVWDAGSEVNDIQDGAAFVAGVDATLGTDENGVVTTFFSDPNASDYLTSILGSTTPAGDITQTFERATLLARITIVPAPGVLAGLLPLGVVGLRRRR